ncbi:hypothetical protein TUZN_1193 [Thermoproteus uzoniensis 768-20]|uniref:Uncharacterized protein n=1 Tax=Thermoproteus uzoniensis (strain 768-20) TaxID=999630 RepID=F2L0J0_THEU7|nr:hypothetical protein [Thermoproteus uzoniensis]AEA12672.1 hypothetical protein TUZN_1193 [Thermoproteus uzoniensis 768-20]
MAGRWVAAALAALAAAIVLYVALSSSGRGPSYIRAASRLVENGSATLVYNATFVLNQSGIPLELQRYVVEYSFNASARELFTSSRPISQRGPIPSINMSIWINGSRLCTAVVIERNGRLARGANCNWPGSPEFFYLYVPLGSLAIGNSTYVHDNYYVVETVHISYIGQRQVLGQVAQCYSIDVERAVKSPPGSTRTNTTETVCLSPQGVPLVAEQTTRQVLEIAPGRYVRESILSNLTLVGYKLGYFDREAFLRNIQEALGG